MKHLQNKIWLLSVTVLIIMVLTWVSLTFYNQKMQDQYNQILERYVTMNELNARSQELVGSLNTFLLEPSDANRRTIDRRQNEITRLAEDVNAYKNEQNESEVTNYTNMVASLVETTDRSINFQQSGESETARELLTESTHIATYVSEMRLSIIDRELTTYNRVYQEIIVQSEKLTDLGVSLLLLSILFLLSFTYWFSQRITKPLEKLTQAAEQLSTGHFQEKIEVDSKDETAILARTFEQMRININNLFIEIRQKAKLEKELQQSKYLLKESQLRSLQSQINPHFLFNTLNTLSKKAYMEGSVETSDLLVSIADLLRYNLKHMDKPMTLREEVHVLTQYIQIQQARYADRLNFSTDIDERCLDMTIPGLTLQPIVENAVIHAIEPQEDGGTITFRIKDHPDRVTIEIQDDGPGIPADKIDDLLSDDETRGNSNIGIGFKNVAQRLRLFNAQEDVVHVHSIIGQGTTITLQLLKERSELPHDQRPYRR